MNEPLVRTLMALTFVTGIVDAACFLALGSVFAAMQTGNVLFLGFGIASADGAPLIAPLVGLSAFLAGGLLADLLATASSARGVAALSLALPVEAALLGAAAVIAALIDVSAGQLSAYVLIAVLSAAMGVRTTTAREVGQENIVTTVLNLSLASLRSPTGLAGGPEVRQRALALVAIAGGAFAGALLLKVSLALAIAAAAGLTAMVRLAAVRAR